MNQTKTTKGRSTLEKKYTKDKCIIGGEHLQRIREEKESTLIFTWLLLMYFCLLKVFPSMRKWDIVRNMFSLVAKEENMMGRLLKMLSLSKMLLAYEGGFIIVHKGVLIRELISHVSMVVNLDRV